MKSRRNAGTSPARLARAKAEDRRDAAWLARCRRIQRCVARQWQGQDPAERLWAILEAKLPPRPAGFERRQQYCNRCGEQTSMSDEFDALYCGRCHRWIEMTCSDPR
jgi:ribosomal protein S27AE